MRIKCLKRAAKVIICAAVFNIVWIRTAQNVQVCGREPLFVAMEAAGARAERVYIEGRGKIAGDYAQATSLNEIARQVALQMGRGETTSAVEETESSYQQSATLSFGEGDRQMLITVKRQIGDAFAKRYIDLDIQAIDGSPDEKDVVEYKDGIVKALHAMRARPKLTVCLVGYIDGALGKDEQKLRLTDAFDAVGAEVNNAAADARYISFTGFSPLIEERSITAGMEKINMNMAMRYHDFDRRTYIVIGAPAISIEY